MQQQAWAGLKNGVLMTTSEAAGFQVFVTGDRNLEHQQNMVGRQLGVVVLVAPSNALDDLVPLVPEALVAIATVQPGQLLRVPAVGSR